jgi:hypothetical protein
MEEFIEVVFAQDKRLATGAHLVVFKADVAKKVAPRLAAAAVKQGAVVVEKPKAVLKAVLAAPKKTRKKRVSKRDA